MGYESGFGMFTILSSIFPIFFIIVLSFILFGFVRNIKEWSNNNKQPKLTVPAKVVSRRTHISRTAHNHNTHVHHSTSTKYYVTFEVESGDRIELRMDGNEYGQIAEGDIGRLSFQGTRFLNFNRV